MMHFAILVNGQSIGHVAIRRQEAVIEDGQPNNYTVKVSMFPGPDKTIKEATVQHHYKDGALTLIRKALEAIEAPR